MAEGGQLPWKVQKIKTFGPTADYSNLSKPLPNPPEGQVWEKDEDSREWKLVSTAVAEEEKLRVHHKKKGELLSDLLEEEEDEEDNEKKEEEKKKLEESMIKAAGPTHIKHVILPTDTMAGICLTYKISAVKLRQVNRFSGSSLTLAPNPLIIPIVDPQLLVDGKIKVQDQDSREFKRGAFRNQFPSMRDGEMTAYLDMNGWDLDAAIQNAKEDIAWEKSQQAQKRQQQPEKEKPSGGMATKAKGGIQKINRKIHTLTAYVAIPVSAPGKEQSSKEKKSYKERIEIELSSSVHGKEPATSPASEKKQKPVKELFRPLLPRR